MIKTSTRPEARRAKTEATQTLVQYAGVKLRPSKYTPHIGKKQLEKAAR